RVAERHALGALRQPDSYHDICSTAAAAVVLEEVDEVDPTRAREMTLPRVTRIPGAPRVLVGRPDVEDRELRVVEPREELVTSRERGEPRLQANLDRREVRRPELQLPRPLGETAQQDGDLRMARQLGELRRHDRPEAVAAVVEDESLLAGHAVAAEPETDLGRERAHRVGIRHRRRRADDEGA